MNVLALARTALILGRVSNLPTVWSNLIAGWFLAGAEGFPPPALLMSGSFLYIGGMYLNDFCDAGFDSQYRPERPIPQRKISRWAVGWAAALWLAAGMAWLLPLGGRSFGVGLLLLAAIVLYDVVHKRVTWAPWIMAGCRFLLYPLAAAVLVDRVPGLAVPRAVILGGLVLAVYVAGITFLARGESRPEKPSRRAWWMLFVPLAGAAISIPSAPNMVPQLAACGLFAAWLTWILLPLAQGTNRSIGRAVSGLLAGIVLADMVAMAPVMGFQAGWLLALFGLALVSQRAIPAT